MPVNRLIVSFIAVVFPSVSWAADEAIRTPHWWEIATGIVAIPAAVIGVFYSYTLVKKTILESKKIELEIREKERQLSNLSAQEGGAASQFIKPLVDPIIDSNKTQNLILRFIIIYLLLQFWEIIERVVNLGVTATALGAQHLFRVELGSTNAMVILLVTIQQIIKFGWIGIVILFGWPLYRDICTRTNFNLGRAFWRPLT